MSVVAAFAVPHPPILLPEIGRGEEKRIQKTADAYRSAMGRIAALRPDTIVLTSPHSVMYTDYFHISPGASARGDMGQFGVRSLQVSADYDVPLVKAISAHAKREGVPAGERGERNKSLDHGSVIPLLFLNEVYTDYKLVRIGLSGLPPQAHCRLGKCIAAAAEELQRRVVLIASGDLSHKLKEDGPYGFAPEGPAFDKAVTEAFAAGDFRALMDFSPDFCDAAAECGLRSFQIMAGALDGKAVISELLSYEGTFGVGYGVAAFEVTGAEDTDSGHRAKEESTAAQKDGDAYVRLARLGLETYIKTGRRASLPKDLPDEMLQKRAGVFVSLKKAGQLRGCIGTISPVTGSVAEEILRNVVSSAVEDPRFYPVREEELPALEYSVDVLSEAEPIDSPAELDVKRYGVIVQAGRRRGLLLPNLEGVDTVEQQIAISRQKAGIGPQEPISLQRFEVVRHT
jgi:AmmeMemoRadiSam system protein A